MCSMRSRLGWLQLKPAAISEGTMPSGAETSRSGFSVSTTCGVKHQFHTAGT